MHPSTERTACKNTLIPRNHVSRPADPDFAVVHAYGCKKIVFITVCNGFTVNNKMAYISLSLAYISHLAGRLKINTSKRQNALS